MQDLILEMQEVLNAAIKRGDSAACDDAKFALAKLKRLSEKITDLEDSLAIAQAAAMNNA